MATTKTQAALAVSPQDFPWAGMLRPFGTTRRQDSRAESAGIERWMIFQARDWGFQPQWPCGKMAC